MKQTDPEDAGISYQRAAQELDERWSFSLQFLPSTSPLRGKYECVRARQIARTEVDLFMRHAREIAEEHGLNFKLLVERYDTLLINRIMGRYDHDESSFADAVSLSRSPR